MISVYKAIHQNLWEKNELPFSWMNGDRFRLFQMFVQHHESCRPIESGHLNRFASRIRPVNISCKQKENTNLMFVNKNNPISLLSRIDIVSQSINQSINQSMDQSINPPIIQPINQSFDC